MNARNNQARSLRAPEPWNEADEDGQLTHRLTQIEIAKAGYKLSNKDLTEMSRGELLSERTNCRRITKEFVAKSEAAFKAGKNEEVTNYLKYADEVSRISLLLDRQITMNETIVSQSGGLGNQMRSSTGARIQVLNKNDSFVDQVAFSGSREDFGFGEYVAAMVSGTNRGDIRNALSEGTDSAGGYTVPKRLMADIIDKMRSKMVCIQAGALTVPLETQVTTIARIASDPTAGWRAENAAVAESDPTFEAVTFTARSLAVLVKVSRELLDDSANIDQALTAAFAGALAVELDRVALIGSGTAPEPRGIFNTTNVNSVSMGTNGAQLTTYGKMLDALYELELDNAAKPTAQVMHPRTWRTIQGFIDSTGQPLQPPPALAGLPQMVTTSIPITQVQGTSGAVCSSAIVGDFSQLLIGVRQDMRIEVLRENFMGNLQYGFIAHLRMDVALAHPESFCKVIGILP